MAQDTYWYARGREFAGEVWDAFHDPGFFKPKNAMREWFDHMSGSGFETRLETDMAHWALSVRSARVEFALGYRAGMRATRIARRIQKQGGSMNVEAVRIDEWGRPVELAPGTTATYNYLLYTDDNDTDIEECLTWYRSKFAAEIGRAERNVANFGDTEGREYALTVTVPASHHVAFRNYLDDDGREDELPEGWERRAL